jgi:PAS domain S-box-containing protein
MSDGAIQAADEFMNLADQRVEAVGYQRPEAGHGGEAAMPGSSELVTTMRRLRPYALAVVLIAIAVGLGVLAWLLGWDKLAFPLILMGIGAAVWYGGPGPGALAIVLGGLCFNYFFTVPLYTFEIHPSEGPYFVAFVLFAVLIGWFASRRRRVERQLRAARDELAVEVVKRTEQASLLDLTHDTILVRGMDDVISYWNHGAQELFGWTSEQAIGKSAHELLHTVFPMPLDRIHAALVRTGRWEGELAKTKADGTQVVVSARWSLRRDEQGHPVAILATNNDITERKRRDERIRQLNADLERRSRDLEASNKELEAFAYSTSHDLRAPLRHMAGYSELLQKHASPVLDEKARRYVTMLLESAKKMGDLIDDLLAFSRIGRAEARNTLVSMDQLVAEAVNEVRPEAPERNIAWKIGALPSLQGDRAMLKLVLVNLVSNAVKFTRTRAQAEIEVGCIDGQPDEVVVFVKDNGVGFDMKYANKLFGVFQRLHRAEAFEGTGIGLATVQRIVARHGGRVWAESVEDGGATFYFSAAKTTGDRT